MINWESIRYDVGRAEMDFEKLEILSSSIVPISPREDFKEIRNQLIEIRDYIFEKYEYDNANKLDYKFDLLFGLKMYQVLNENVGFTNRVATNDDIWRYLSICVIPDIVHSRWELNEERFYKSPRRIWLKALWWYIHLSWRGNEEETYNILKDNTTDTVVQLVERPGIGYHVEMYREIMYQYSFIQDSSREVFRRLLKLNTATILTTTPELVEGGIKKYVQDLYNAVV
ncbi:hypothetical protein [Mammaliicoccus lentus]|uniref:hypothetical protein n=1 Tax=Mammaliicoccus lentus TaxID=42858 RepID=UPI001E42295A|nr:hypothetical protein [Mammaliicoccus lentus]MCD2478898.1 hypothetical protein [Mammaliicoccus lentus]MCD2521113.1 hypothetical protein [Mammaliicoccus lentus]MDQ7142106.1 hypothetical protein [Mammaliicoccus lentus]